MDHNTTRGKRHLRNVGVRRHRAARSAGAHGGERLHEVMRVHVVATRFLRPGAVVLAQVPYADGIGFKTRPVVVLGVEAGRVIAMPCTTSAARRRRPDHHVELTDLGSAGLTRPTGVRRTTVTLDRWVVVKVMGMLAGTDRTALLGETPQGPVAA